MLDGKRLKMSVLGGKLECSDLGDFRLFLLGMHKFRFGVLVCIMSPVPEVYIIIHVVDIGHVRYLSHSLQECSERTFC